MDEAYYYADAIDMDFSSDSTHTTGNIANGDMTLSLKSPCGIDSLLAGFSRTGALAAEQAERLVIDADTLRDVMPQFDCSIKVGKKNLASQFLESSGVEYSDDSVFRGANYIVTPTERNTPEAIALCRQLGEVLGFARISELSPRKHDEMIAFLSQLTHCIAVVLMNCNTTPNLEAYTGDSFRDLTRIARINDKMWAELFLWNRDNLISEIDQFDAALGTLRSALAAGDREKLEEMFRLSTRRRAAFDKKLPE